MIERMIAARLGGRAFARGAGTYKFARIKAARDRAIAANPGRPLIDLGVGEGDEAADPAVAGRIAREAGLRENRRYADSGIAEFQQAAAAWLREVFGLRVDAPESRIVHGIGSKPILAALPACFIDPGDAAIVASPGYPVLGTWTEYLGGRVVRLPLRAANGFFPDFSELRAEDLHRAKLLYLNYPNNPTGVAPTEAFFREALRFAERNRVLIVHDAAYGALVHGGRKPLSIMSLPGAEELAVEVHSLSKAFDMTGWRLGFALGSPLAIRAYATVKDNTDSGQFRAVQKAGVEALARPELTRALQRKYERRFGLLLPALRGAGFEPAGAEGGFYCYAPAPTSMRDPASGKRREFANAEEASLAILEKALVSTVPWDDAGAYLRISATFEARGEEAERAVAVETGRRLGELGLDFTA